MENENHSWAPPLKLAENMISAIIGKSAKAITNFALYKLDFSYFQWSINWECMMKYFKHIPGDIQEYRTNEVRQKTIEFEYGTPSACGKFYDFIIWDRMPLVLTMENIPDKDGMIRRSYILYTVYTKRGARVLRNFVRQLIKDSQEYDKKQSKITWRQVINGCNSLIRRDRPKRTWDDVFIKDVDQKRIDESVHKFLESETWYHDHKIPYHFGILLHGNPGTGKSSVVQAIINSFPCDVYYVTPGCLGDFITNCSWINTDNHIQTRVIIIEDVDTESFVESRKKKTDDDDNFSFRPKFSLGTLLNFMDGMGNPQDTIWILTTNHIDKLDDALIRPGRIDLCVEVGYIDNEILLKFMRFHYGTESLPMGFQIRPGLTCAELNTKVMTGYTEQQLLEYVAE